MVELGLPEYIAVPARAALGADAADVIAGDPWSVLAVPGVRPEQADGYARSRLGPAARPDDERRQLALVRWLLSRAARDGHTVLPLEIAGPALAGYGLNLASAVGAAARAGVVVEATWRDGGLALPGLAVAEESIAKAIASRRVIDSDAVGDRTTPRDMLAPAEPTLAVRAEAAGLARDSELVRSVEQARARDESVLLVASTLGGAIRLSHLVRERAVTIAELLTDRDMTSSRRDLLLVDDAECLDAPTTAALLAAVEPVESVRLVMDPQGIPPTHGPGDPGRDLHTWLNREARTPEENHHPTREDQQRHPAATIADLVRAIGEGRLPPVESPNLEVVVVAAGSGREAAQRAIQLVTDAIPRAIGINTADIMVLGVARGGVAGVDILNRELKARLNPGNGTFGGFDTGDRVAFATESGRARPGDVGSVVAAEESELLVDVAGEPVRAPIRERALEHARALPIAQAAVGRWPAVVVVLPGESAGYLSRELLRTAFSRAGRHLSVIHAAGPSLARTVTRGYNRTRRTLLPHFLEELRSSRPPDPG